MRQKISENKKTVPQRAFFGLFMKEIAGKNYMLHLAKKTQIARENDIAFFASEKFKKLFFLDLPKKIYMTEKLLVEKNTAVGR